MKSFLMAEVKSVKDSSEPNGEFEVILSAPTLDRDEEVIDAKAFEPLPDHITFDIDHAMSVEKTVGSGVPRYDGDLLKVRGTYASTPLAQMVRTLVDEKHIRSTSVAFMDATRETDEKDGKVHIRAAELLNGAFVGIPSNREALVLSSKEYGEKVGARNSSKDQERLQNMHDHAVELGAVCSGTTRSAEPTDEKADEKSTTTDPETPPLPAAAPPADVNVALAKLAALRADADLLLLTD